MSRSTVVCPTVRGWLDPAIARPLVVFAVAACVLLMTPARGQAHETLHEIKRAGAVAVRAYFADGEALAYSAYEIYSPSDPKIPYQKGRTDREGWVAFLPSTAGKWRVKIFENTGHGLDLEVDAELGGATTVHPDEASTFVESAAFILRPVVGTLVVSAIFAVLFVAYRRKSSVRGQEEILP